MASQIGSGCFNYLFGIKEPKHLREMMLSYEIKGYKRLTQYGWF